MSCHVWRLFTGALPSIISIIACYPHTHPGAAARSAPGSSSGSCHHSKRMGLDLPPPWSCEPSQTSPARHFSMMSACHYHPASTIKYSRSAKKVICAVFRIVLLLEKHWAPFHTDLKSDMFNQLPIPECSMPSSMEWISCVKSGPSQKSSPHTAYCGWLRDPAPPWMVETL